MRSIIIWNELPMIYFLKHVCCIENKLIAFAQSQNINYKNNMDFFFYNHKKDRKNVEPTICLFQTWLCQLCKNLFSNNCSTRLAKNLSYFSIGRQPHILKWKANSVALIQLLGTQVLTIKSTVHYHQQNKTHKHLI